MTDRSWLSRTELLIGNDHLETLKKSHVLVIGLGGVGSFAAEFLARAGIGMLTIADGDIVEASNRNRQLPATVSTTGQYKVQIMHDRLMDINPELKINVIQEFIQPEAVAVLFDAHYDYVVEAIDSITPKLMVLSTAYKKNLNIVSSMGAGGKLDPTCLRVADLMDTHQCPFAQTVRKRIKGMDVHRGIKAVFSTEPIIKESLIMTDGTRFKKSAYGTISYLPATFGAVCSSVVIRDLTIQTINS
ncbi:tRNA threonylcarbamoyladenosine dehydratase [soil metagenome]